MAPTYNIAFKLTDIWQGNAIHIPEGSDRMMLLAESTTPRPTDGIARKWSTSQRDAIDCIPMQSGLTGEGYRVRTTEGISYYFDTATTRYGGTLEKSIGEGARATSSRERIYVLATRVEDRYGNWVQYAYNGDGRPVRIWSSDGREINLVYNGKLLATASAARRTWSYYHGQVDGVDRLGTVVQPDGSRWTYAYSSALRVSVPMWDGNSQPGCGEQPPEVTGALTMTIGHPAGAVGEFKFGNVRHYRSGVHASECARKIAGNGSYYYELATPYFFDVVSLFSKTITGPGIDAPLAWTYGYGSGYEKLWGNPDTGAAYPCTTCKSEKAVTVTNPDGSAVRYRYGSQYALNEGRLLGSSMLDAAGNVVKTSTSVYMTSDEVAGQPFAPRFGIIWNGEDPSTAQVRPVLAEAIEQDGVSYQTTMLAFDDLARPTRVKTNLHFPDLNGDQNWEYTPDGKPLKVYTLSEGGTSHAANSYIYNKRRLISAEYVGEMTIGSEVIQYAYDPGGALASTTYPSGRQVDYAPNALGQATKAGSYASNVQYYPNGGMKQFTYGNGLVHSMAQNARQLPARVTDGGGALDTTYEYDANGNVGRIVDHLDANRTRTMAYDGLDRLMSADSPSFGGDGAFRYTYDALDNIRSARLGGVKDHGYWYDARNRMTNVQNSGGATTIALDYDVQGNMVKRNGAAFVFDFGNRLLQATGTESYRYDMHGRRLLQLASDGSASIWSFYGSDGLLKRQRNYRAGTSTEYVHLNGSLVAKATQYIAPAAPTVTAPAFSGTGMAATRRAAGRATWRPRPWSMRQRRHRASLFRPPAWAAATP